MKQKTMILTAVASVAAIIVVVAVVIAISGNRTKQTEPLPDVTEAAIHDTSEKENTHQEDLQLAKDAETGSTETLNGKYKIEGTSNNHIRLRLMSGSALV